MLPRRLGFGLGFGFGFGFGETSLMLPRRFAITLTQP